jgi:hypothetical protein
MVLIEWMTVGGADLCLVKKAEALAPAKDLLANFKFVKCALTFKNRASYIRDRCTATPPDVAFYIFIFNNYKY